MASANDAFTVLSRHQGKGNGITAAQLAVALGVSKRRVRHLVTKLRNQGIALCGRPTTGYFIAKTAEEWDVTCEFLYNRAMHSLTIIAKGNKVAVPELRGQLRLKT